MAYASSSDLKTYLDITSSGDDTLIADVLTRAQALIEAATNRVFEAAANSSRLFDAVTDVEGAVLYLDEDLASINSITNGDSGATAITSGQYVSEPRNETPYYAIRLLDSTSLDWEYNADPENAITVNGKWAYSESAPADIVQATVRLAAFLYRQKESNVDVDRVMQLPDGSMVLPSGLPRDVTSIIKKYRKVR
jgi:hypothetical protein